MTTYFHDLENKTVEASAADIAKAEFNKSNTIGTITKPTNCIRCGGSGIYSRFHGVCYRCGGCGVDPRIRNITKIYTEKALGTLRKTRETRRATAIKKENARIEVINAKKAETIKANDLQPALDWISSTIIKKDFYKVTEFDFFLSDLYTKLCTKGSLSEKQIGVIKNAHKKHLEVEAKKADDAKNATPCPTGRVDIIGEVLTTKWKSSYYGDTLKMLVRSSDGYIVWGTVPSSLSDVKSGEKVKFTATVEKSIDDEAFGFFKRPSKAEIVI